MLLRHGLAMLAIDSAPPHRTRLLASLTISAETPAPAVSGHKYTSYDSSKPKTALRIRLCVGRVINVEVTEDWDYEDLYAFVTNAEPGFAFDLLGGYPPKKLAVDGTKVLASGLGGSVIRQVRKCPVSCNKQQPFHDQFTGMCSSQSSLVSSATAFSAG